MEEEEVKKYLDYEGLILYHRSILNILDLKVNIDDLADVAFTGDYNDLINKPINVSTFINDAGYITNEIDNTNDHAFVEIGGIKWATMNIGADNITDTGLYFLWGDNKGYSAEEVGINKQFNWGDYKFNPSGDGVTFIKYNDSDQKTVLDTEDDPVALLWGSDWRTPTYSDLQTLKESVNISWIDDYEDSGVSGFMLTDKTDDEKVLFFPTTGLCSSGSIISEEEGFYWSKSLSENTKSSGIGFGFNNEEIDWDINYPRCYGYCIRGILNGPEKRAIMGVTQAEKNIWNNKINNDDLQIALDEYGNAIYYDSNSLKIQLRHENVILSEFDASPFKYTNGKGISLNNNIFSLALTKALVTEALGYTPPTTDTWRTIQCNGTSIGNNILNIKAGTNVTLSNSNGVVTISSTDTNTWPSKVSLLTNDTGFITGITKAMVTNALGYTPPTTDTNTWRTVLCNGTSIGNNTLNIKAGTNVTLSNSNGAITISSTDTNTWPTYTSLLTNNSGFITGITKAMVTNALGYTPPTSDTNTWRTVLCNGTSIGNNTLNIKAGTNVSLSNSNGTITISSTDTNTWPTYTSQLTNNSGFITGINKTMVVNALGYTPPTTNTTYPTVTLWGLSFNHSLNVNGTITLTNGSLIAQNDSGSTARELLRLSASNSFFIGNGSSAAKYDTYLNGNTIYIRTGSSHSNTIVCNTAATQINRILQINDSSGIGLFVFYPDTSGSDAPNLWTRADIIMAEGLLLEVKNTRGRVVVLLDGADGQIKCVTLVQTSDISLKENITDVPEDTLNKISDVNFKKFNFKGDNKTQYGVIAQDLQKLGLDSLISLDKEGLLSVNYILLLMLKIELLNKHITILENRIEELENKNN